MRLAELKARLVGRTIVDVDLSISEEMDAIVIGRITLDDGTQVSTEASHSPVWIDYLLEGEDETYITVSPDHADYPVEEDEDGESTWEGEAPKVVMLTDVLSSEEKAAVLAQCWMNGESIIEKGVVVSVHEGEPLPFRTMGGKTVTRWYEIEWGMNGMTREPNHAIIGIGTLASFPERVNIIQGIRLKAEWSNVSTGFPK